MARQAASELGTAMGMTPARVVEMPTALRQGKQQLEHGDDGDDVEGHCSRLLTVRDQPCRGRRGTAGCTED